jgi:large subunit ribosomal protein L22
MRLVVDLIRGKSVDEALHILHFSPKHASKLAEKVLRSAASNLQNKDDAGRLETADMHVKEVFVDVAPTMKRISPAPMGRAYRIRKRSHHITIVVEGRPSAPAKGHAKPATPAKKAEPARPKAAGTEKKKEPATPKAAGTKKKRATT